ncbi:MAG: ubiquinol-cytochrome C chaperone [Alphaproteobacteria bacterium]|nr:ubiquinol-cytochrome C chaperone [Alphaproteobacteria bacterium]
MLNVLQSLFRASPLKTEAAALYDAIGSQARHPGFYTTLSVPDTLDGRFELVVLHAAMVFHGIRRHGEAGRALAQTTCDLMFKSFDTALRELGVGDLSVPKRVKAMAGAYRGRMDVYEAAFRAEGDDALIEALGRNVFRGRLEDPRPVTALSAYVRQTLQNLEALPLSAYETGNLSFGNVHVS